MAHPRLRPYLDVLILGTHYHGSAGVNSLYAHLGAAPTVRTLNSTHQEDHARSLIGEGKVNTLFLDPSVYGWGDESVQSMAGFITDIRDQYPDIVFVIYDYGRDHFIERVGSRFQHYFFLDKGTVNYHAGPELHQMLLNCEDWQRDRYEYDVALSFAGEDRQYADALAESVRKRLVRVFYDAYEQADLWGKNLYTHLQEVYTRKARYCVMFASQQYAAKVWTSHEREAAQERALHEKGAEYILPVRIDDTRIPGLSSSIAYLSIQIGIEQVADLLIQKVGVYDDGETTLSGKWPLDEARERAMRRMDEFYKQMH